MGRKYHLRILPPCRSGRPSHSVSMRQSRRSDEVADTLRAPPRRSSRRASGRPRSAPPAVGRCRAGSSAPSRTCTTVVAGRRRYGTARRVAFAAGLRRPGGPSHGTWSACAGRCPAVTDPDERITFRIKSIMRHPFGHAPNGSCSRCIGVNKPAGYSLHRTPGNHHIIGALSPRAFRRPPDSIMKPWPDDPLGDLLSRLQKIKTDLDVRWEGLVG